MDIFARTILPFSIIVVIAYGYIKDSRTSIELVGLGFFAAVGAVSAALEFAEQKLRRSVAQGGPVNFKAMNNLVLLLLAMGGCALLLASGGGILRRMSEFGAASILRELGHPLRACYKVAETIVWSLKSVAWKPVLYGGAIGAVLGLLLTWNLASARLPDLQEKLRGHIKAADGFGTAFFAAYGIEAAIKFIDALPVAAPATPQLLSLSQVAFFLVGGFFLCTIAGVVTGCGGGLCKALFLDIVLLRLKNLGRSLRGWWDSPDVNFAGGVAIIGWIAYQAIDASVLAFGQCRTIDDGLMYLVILVCAVGGAVAWVNVPD